MTAPNWELFTVADNQATDFCNKLVKASVILVPSNAVNHDEGLYDAACWVYSNKLENDQSDLLLQAVYDSTGCQDPSNPLWQNFTVNAKDHGNVNAFDVGSCVTDLYDNIINNCESMVKSQINGV